MGRRCSRLVTMVGNQVSRPVARPRLGYLGLVCAAQWKPGFHAARAHNGAQLPDSFPALAQSIAIEQAFRCRHGGHKGVGRPYRTRAEDSRYSSGRTLSLVEFSLAGTRCVDQRRVTKWKPGFQSLHPSQCTWSGDRNTSKQDNRVVGIPRLVTTDISDHAAMPNRSNDRREASSITILEPGALSSTRRMQDGQHS